MSEINCCVDSNTQYFDILDKADLVRIGRYKLAILVYATELYNMSHINSKRVGVDQEDPTGHQERTSRSLL